MSTEAGSIPASVFLFIIIITLNLIQSILQIRLLLSVR